MSKTGAVLILAAGISKRFGSDKRTHLINRKPIIQKTIDIYSGECLNIHVVHRPKDQLEQVVTTPCNWIEAPLAHLGMSQSIKAGVSVLKKQPWVIIALADMPYISKTTIKKLTEALNQGAVIARPSYQGRPGNPVGFSQIYYQQLMRLKGHDGAKELLSKERQKVQLIDVNDKGIVLDIDRKSDIKND